MSIKYVILGYLNWRPMTGTEIKRLIAESDILPWTASGNEIYQALVQLHKDGRVNKTVEEQSDGRNQQVYAITKTGIQALNDWLGGPPQPPPTMRPFLNQLMWADGLNPQEMDELLAAYLNEVGEKLFFLRVQAVEGPDKPDRTPREKYLWDMIYKNWIAHYEVELNWVRQVGQEMKELDDHLARQERMRRPAVSG